MQNKDFDSACQVLAAMDDDNDRAATLKDSLIGQLRDENAYDKEQAALIVGVTISGLRGAKPERVAVPGLRDGEHRLPSGGILIVRDGILHELHTPLRLCDMSTNHDARRITVDEANRVAGCDFDVACLWGKTDKSWVASWFRRGKRLG
jgi:hypothetical protein